MSDCRHKYAWKCTEPGWKLGLCPQCMQAWEGKKIPESLKQLRYEPNADLDPPFHWEIDRNAQHNLCTIDLANGGEEVTCRDICITYNWGARRNGPPDGHHEKVMVRRISIVCVERRPLGEEKIVDFEAITIISDALADPNKPILPLENFEKKEPLTKFGRQWKIGERKRFG